jgi:hypothetical protein
MESNWATENLQTIRTLMERSAVYRRALAPITTFAGSVGIISGCLGSMMGLESTRAFALYWMAVSLVAIAGAFILVRRQALKDREAFWSPPTRRVGQAMLPGLFVGMVAGVFFAINSGDAREMDHALDQAMLIVFWTLAYGCALHSASFFMPRGVRLFSWAFILIGCVLLAAFTFREVEAVSRHLFMGLLFQASFIMGIVFGASHLAYGIYLYFTEPRKNEA